MKLDKLVRRNMEAAERHVIRSRREVVQHAAAFQYLVDEFVCRKRPMSEDLIKQTHAIMVKNGGAEDAGVLNSKEFGGLYRQEDAYVGTTEFPKPSKIGEAMQAMVKDLAQDLESAQSEGVLDPFMIAATYSDRFVNIHPFRDGNGRMCRLILNAIHVKYAGIVVNLGEHDQNREDYIAVAAESREVRGHPGALGHLVLNESSRTLRKFVDSLKKSLRAS